MPPRSRHGGRTVTYHLSSQSSRAAFEHGLDIHDDISDDERPSALGSSPPSASSLCRSQQRRSNRPFGQAHAECSGGSLLGGGSERNLIELINLFELFPAAERSLVEEVYAGCAFSFDEALDSLSALLASQEGAEETLSSGAVVHAVVHAEEPAEQHWGGAHGTCMRPWQPFAVHLHCIPVPRQCAICYYSLLCVQSSLLDYQIQACWITKSNAGTPKQTQFSKMDAGEASWEAIPEEVKELILGYLPARDVAKAAATCHDFAKRVKRGAINARILTIPVGECT